MSGWRDADLAADGAAVVVAVLVTSTVLKEMGAGTAMISFAIVFTATRLVLTLPLWLFRRLVGK